MMEFIKGNLLDADTQALVNTVNTVGVMGKGIALQFKEAFPVNYSVYMQTCKKKELQPGKLLVVTEHNIKGERIIINFPTKTNWHLKSKYEYIEDGLKELRKVIDTYQIKSIAIPPLGCGNGGLKWSKVKEMMQHYLNDLDQVHIVIFEPNAAVKEILKNQKATKDVQLTPARAMLLYAMFYYESLGENVSLFVANKLAYFLQRLGEKSLHSLRFEAGNYGPYTVQVEHMLHLINGKYIKGLEQMEAKAFEPLVLQYNKMSEVSNYIRKDLSVEHRDRMKSLIKLINGFESALALEVLASVDFVRKDHPKIEKKEIVNTIHNWSERKKELFQEKYIEIAINHLKDYSTQLNFE